MKYSIKQFLKRWAITYAIINLVFFVACYIVQRRFGISLSYLKVSIGAVLIAVFVTISISLFKMKKGNQVVKTATGLIALAPVVIIAKQIYGSMVFRYSFVIYIFAAICAISYCVAVFVVARRAKIDEKELNSLLHSGDEKSEKKDN